jgi:hypothetical protein
MNLDDPMIHRASHIFSCPVGDFPLKYLGVPLHFPNLLEKTFSRWQNSEKIAGWRAVADLGVFSGIPGNTQLFWYTFI